MKLAKLALLAAWVGFVLSGAAAHADDASTSVDGILTFPVTAVDLPLPKGGTHVVS